MGTVTKDTIQIAMTACINSYVGEYGPVDKSPFDKWVPHKKGHVEWSFGYKGKSMYIIFRGSDGTADWLDNFRFWHRVIPYQEKGTNNKIKIHTGFYDQYRSVREGILAVCHKETFVSETTIPNITDIIVTGHSLGGALTTLCALDLQYNFGHWFEAYGVNLFCVTFGSPRVGNRAFVNSFDKRFEKGESVRFVNGDDVVCKVPPALMFYKHVFEKKRIGKRRWYKFLSGSVGDHYPQEYKKSLVRFYA